MPRPPVLYRHARRPNQTGTSGTVASADLACQGGLGQLVDDGGGGCALDGVCDGIRKARDFRRYMVSVVIVELWFFCIPSQCYIKKRTGLDRRTVALLRSLNLAIGLLFLTPWNPIYSFVDSFFPGR
jgi:hypothetical protein